MMGQAEGGKRYRVVFLGAAKRDFKEVDRLVANLQKIFGLSPHVVAYLMRMVPVTIKKDASLETAMRYKEVFEALGGRVSVEPIVREEVLETQERPFYGFSGGVKKIPIKVRYLNSFEERTSL